MDIFENEMNEITNQNNVPFIECNDIIINANYNDYFADEIDEIEKQMYEIEFSKIDTEIKKIDKEIQGELEYLERDDIKCDSYFDLCYEYLNELEYKKHILQLRKENDKNKESGL